MSNNALGALRMYDSSNSRSEKADVDLVPNAKSGERLKQNSDGALNALRNYDSSSVSSETVVNPGFPRANSDGLKALRAYDSSSSRLEKKVGGSVSKVKISKRPAANYEDGLKALRNYDSSSVSSDTVDLMPVGARDRLSSAKLPVGSAGSLFVSDSSSQASSSDPQIVSAGRPRKNSTRPSPGSALVDLTRESPGAEVVDLTRESPLQSKARPLRTITQASASQPSGPRSYGDAGGLLQQYPLDGFSASTASASASSSTSFPDNSDAYASQRRRVRSPEVEQALKWNSVWKEYVATPATSPVKSVYLGELYEKVLGGQWTPEGLEALFNKPRETWPQWAENYDEFLRLMSVYTGRMQILSAAVYWFRWHELDTRRAKVGVLQFLRADLYAGPDVKHTLLRFLPGFVNLEVPCWLLHVSQMTGRETHKLPASAMKAFYEWACHEVYAAKGLLWPGKAQPGTRAFVSQVQEELKRRLPESKWEAKCVSPKRGVANSHPYQRVLEQVVTPEWSFHGVMNRLLVVWRTGAGKTLGMLKILNNFFHDSRPRIIILPGEAQLLSFLKQLVLWDGPYRTFISTVLKRTDWTVEEIVSRQKEILSLLRLSRHGHNFSVDVRTPGASLVLETFEVAGGTTRSRAQGYYECDYFQGKLLKRRTSDRNPYDGFLVILDEVHNVFRPTRSDLEQKRHQLRDWLTETAPDTVLLCFTATPVVPEMLELHKKEPEPVKKALAPLMNMVRGRHHNQGEYGFVSYALDLDGRLYPQVSPGNPDLVLPYRRVVVLQGLNLQKYLEKSADKSRHVSSLQRYCNSCWGGYGHLNVKEVSQGTYRFGKGLEPVDVSTKMAVTAEHVLRDKRKTLVLVRNSTIEAFAVFVQVKRLLGSQARVCVVHKPEDVGLLARFNSMDVNSRGADVQVLIANTVHFSESTDFRMVERCILADVPGNYLAYQQLVGRVMRACQDKPGHRVEFEMVVAHVPYMKSADETMYEQLLESARQTRPGYSLLKTWSMDGDLWPAVGTGAAAQKDVLVALDGSVEVWHPGVTKKASSKPTQWPRVFSDTIKTFMRTLTGKKSQSISAFLAGLSAAQKLALMEKVKEQLRSEGGSSGKKGSNWSKLPMMAEFLDVQETLEQLPIFRAGQMQVSLPVLSSSDGLLSGRSHPYMNRVWQVPDFEKPWKNGACVARALDPVQDVSTLLRNGLKAYYGKLKYPKAQKTVPAHRTTMEALRNLGLSETTPDVMTKVLQSLSLRWSSLYYDYLYRQTGQLPDVLIAPYPDMVSAVTQGVIRKLRAWAGRVPTLPGVSRAQKPSIKSVIFVMQSLIEETSVTELKYLHEAVWLNIWWQAFGKLSDEFQSQLLRVLKAYTRLTQRAVLRLEFPFPAWQRYVARFYKVSADFQQNLRARDFDNLRAVKTSASVYVQQLGDLISKQYQSPNPTIILHDWLEDAGAGWWLRLIDYFARQGWHPAVFTGWSGAFALGLNRVVFTLVSLYAKDIQSDTSFESEGPLVLTTGQKFGYQNLSLQCVGWLMSLALSLLEPVYMQRYKEAFCASPEFLGYCESLRVNPKALAQSELLASVKLAYVRPVRMGRPSEWSDAGERGEWTDTVVLDDASRGSRAGRAGSSRTDRSGSLRTDRAGSFGRSDAARLNLPDEAFERQAPQRVRRPRATVPQVSQSLSDMEGLSYASAQRAGVPVPQVSQSLSDMEGLSYASAQRAGVPVLQSQGAINRSSETMFEYSSSSRPSVQNRPVDVPLRNSAVADLPVSASSRSSRGSQVASQLVDPGAASVEPPLAASGSRRSVRSRSGRPNDSPQVLSSGQNAAVAPVEPYQAESQAEAVQSAVGSNPSGSNPAFHDAGDDPALLRRWMTAYGNGVKKLVNNWPYGYYANVKFEPLGRKRFGYVVTRGLRNCVGESAYVTFRELVMNSVGRAGMKLSQAAKEQVVDDVLFSDEVKCPKVTNSEKKLLKEQALETFLGFQLPRKKDVEVFRKGDQAGQSDIWAMQLSQLLGHRVLPRALQLKARELYL